MLGGEILFFPVMGGLRLSGLWWGLLISHKDQIIQLVRVSSQMRCRWKSWISFMLGGTYRVLSLWGDWQASGKIDYHGGTSNTRWNHGVGGRDKVVCVKDSCVVMNYSWMTGLYYRYDDFVSNCLHNIFEFIWLSGQFSFISVNISLMFLSCIWNLSINNTYIHTYIHT